MAKVCTTKEISCGPVRAMVQGEKFTGADVTMNQSVLKIGTLDEMERLAVALLDVLDSCRRELGVT